MIDPLLYYDFERYLLETVGPHFRQSGSIGAFDFFSIIVWKSNRSKSTLARRLMATAPGDDLEQITRRISAAVWKAKDEKAKMRVLIVDWKFRLPIASALLTIWYPETFTVYDYRAADQVGDTSQLATKTRFEDIWSGYVEFRRKVQAVAQGRTLREKDRYLFGKSRLEDLQQALKYGFSKNEGDRSRA